MPPVLVLIESISALFAVVKNPEMERWLNDIGQRLAKAPEANACPYYFKLVNELRKNDNDLHSAPSSQATLGGQPALLTKMTTKRSARADSDQVLSLYTVGWEAGLWYVVLAASQAQIGELDPVLKQIVSTAQFPN